MSDDGLSRVVLTVLTATLVVGVSGNAADAGGKKPRFTGEIVDAKNSGDCKAVADLDDDGLLDGVVGGADLVWYEAPDWKKHTIAEAQDEFTTDCQAVDVDRDGHVDIVVPDGKDGMNLLWFENPGSPDATWPRHEIGSFGDFVHDLEVGDLDGDGRVDVVTRSGAKPTSVWYQLSPSKWREQVIGDRAGDGTSIGDVDDDGDLDVMTGGYWLENDGSAGLWPQHEIEAADAASTFVADVDGDGKNDVFIGPNEAEGQVSWYRAGPDGTWTPHPIAKNPDQKYHTFKAADVDDDGAIDLVTAGMDGDVIVYLNRRGGETWSPLVVSRGTGLHNLRVGDFEDDGDVDIFGSNFIGGPPVRLWLNQLH